MAPPAALQDYQEQTTHGVPLLGRISWYGVQEGRIRHDRLVQLLEQQGLRDWAPRAPADSDTFRKVCTAMQRKRMDTGQDEVYLNILVRDVAGNEDEIVKRVVAEEVDPKGHRLSYIQTHDLVFVRTTAQVRVDPLAPLATIPAAASALADEIPTEYSKARGTVTSSAIRELLGKVLDGSGSVCVRATGGVFFTPEDKAWVVERLDGFARNIATCDFHALPLVDTAAQREMVKRAIEEETTTEVDRLQLEMQALASAGASVSAEKVAAYHRRYTEIVEKAAGYSRLLEDGLAVTQSRVQVLKHAYQQLVLSSTSADVDDDKEEAVAS